MRNLLAAPVDSAKPERAGGLRQGVPSNTVRVCYRKCEPVRFISHLDLLREIERTLRRADVPVVYTEGYSPRPKLSAGPPLALGWTSDAEWLDLDLELEGGEGWSDRRLRDLLGALNAAAAPGIEFRVAATMPDHVGSLVSVIHTSQYVARLPARLFHTGLGQLEQAISALLAASSVSITRTRRRTVKTVDIRPLVHDLSVIGDDEIVLILATGPNGSVKPTEVLRAALDLDERSVPLIRIHKCMATLASGESPEAGAVAIAQVGNIETGNIDYSFEPARNACGDSGGPAAC